MDDSGLAALVGEYEQAVDRMGDPVVLSDQRELQKAGRRVKQLEPVV